MDIQFWLFIKNLMKVLIVSTSDISGGASRATFRLHQALINKNIKSQMLVISKSSNDKNVQVLRPSLNKFFYKLSYLTDSILTRLYKKRQKRFFSNNLFSFNGLVKNINLINPDVVHFHWVGNGLFSIIELNKIKAPVIWSLHDNWLFTGGCHIMLDCYKYKVECKSCPNLGSSIDFDLSRLNFYIKKKALKKKVELTIIGLSRWIYNCSKNSILLKDKTHYNIPNLIDTKVFKPRNKKIARSKLGLPLNKKLILFGALDSTSEFNKGFELLINTVKHINNSEIELLVFGRANKEDLKNINLKSHYLGYFDNDIDLVQLYNTADVMLVPSLQENLSNTIMEAMSCGVPVVAFNIGGNSDLIEHKHNGYLAKPYECNDLKKGIDWALSNENLGINARAKILKEFESTLVVKRYINLYKKITKI